MRLDQERIGDSGDPGIPDLLRHGMKQRIKKRYSNFDHQRDCLDGLCFDVHSMNEKYSRTC